MLQEGELCEIRDFAALVLVVVHPHSQEVVQVWISCIVTWNADEELFDGPGFIRDGDSCRIVLFLDQGSSGEVGTELGGGGSMSELIGGGCKKNITIIKTIICLNNIHEISNGYTSFYPYS